MLDDPNGDPDELVEGAPKPNALGVSCDLPAPALDAGAPNGEEVAAAPKGEEVAVAPNGEGVEDEGAPNLNTNGELFCWAALPDATGAVEVLGAVDEEGPPNRYDDFGASPPVVKLDEPNTVPVPEVDVEGAVGKPNVNCGVLDGALDAAGWEALAVVLVDGMPNTGFVAIAPLVIPNGLEGVVVVEDEPAAGVLAAPPKGEGLDDDDDEAPGPTTPKLNLIGGSLGAAVEAAGAADEAGAFGANVKVGAAGFELSLAVADVVAGAEAAGAGAGAGEEVGFGKPKMGAEAAVCEGAGWPGALTDVAFAAGTLGAPNVN